MVKYNIAKGLTADKLKECGFSEESTEKKNNKKYYVFRQLTSDTNMSLTIFRKGKRFKYTKDSAKILVGYESKIACAPEVIERNTYLGFPVIAERFHEEMNTFVEAGILTKKLVNGKKSK